MSRPQRTYKLYGIGSALLDMEVNIDEAFCKTAGIDKGCMALIDQTRQAQLLEQLNLEPAHTKRACGGSVANTVIGYSCFGGRTFFSCVLGKDEAGDFYRQNLKVLSVDSNAHISDTGSTGKCLVMITPDGERTMGTFLGANAELDESIIDEDALARSEYLYLEGYLLGGEYGFQAMSRACTLAQQCQTQIVLSLSDRSIITHFGQHIDTLIESFKIAIIFGNEEEVLQHAGQKDLSTAMEIIGKRVPHLIVTRGEAGAIIRQHDQNTMIRGYPAQAVDTNGAGDMFAAAYLHSISHGCDTLRAGSFAAFSAAHLVGHYGPRLKAADYPELLERFESN
jgi:sugar/nucleoside kinase (ribokinase family)